MNHHHLTLGWILLLAGLAAAAIPASERAALVALYNATNGASWTHNDGWLGAAGTECQWFGVTCNEDESHVIRLELGYQSGASNNLAGSLPPEIAQLTWLTGLNLSDNALSGQIPPEFWGMSSLISIQLWGNDLEGSLPAAVENLTNVQTLDLFGNALSGPLPSQLGNLPDLVGLTLDYNQFEGAIPPQLGNLARLQTLRLTQNNFSGSIPAALFNPPNLSQLHLASNSLTGPIPPEIGNAVNLTQLYLNSNDLTGPLPTQMGNLTKLRNCILYGNELTGAIPTQLGNLSSLRQLWLYQNSLTGEIPSELGNLAQLQSLLLLENQFSGSIPPELGQLANLEELNLSNNMLSGTIPAALGYLSALEYMNLSRNYLTGPLPATFGQLTHVYWLDLGSNRLTGPLPPQLMNMTSLEAPRLDLRFNALYTDDPAVQAFVDAHYFSYGAPPFGRLQTTAPADVTWTWDKDNGSLEWTAIPYDDSPGYYEVWGSAVRGGPYRLLAQTASKAEYGVYLEGYDPAAPFFVAVRTVSEPDVSNDNTVVSEFSPEVRLGPEVTQTKALAAHVADNEAWGSQVTVVNTDGAAQEVMFAAVNAAGELVETVTWASLAAGAALAANVADLFTPDTLAQDIWIAVVGEGSLAGQASFGTKDGQTQVTIPVTGEWCTELVFPYVISSEALGYFTGITLVNTAPDHVVATLEAYAETGEKLGRVQVEIPGYGKYVRLLGGVFEVADISQVRFVRVAAYRPLIAFELFGSYANAGMAGLPSFTPAAAAAKSAREVHYNFVPDNAAYYTGVTVSNLGAEDATLQAQLWDAGGNLLAEADWPEPVAPGEQVTREVWGLFDGTVYDAAAWLKVAGDQPLLGFELMLSRDGGPFRFDGLMGVNTGATDWIFPDVRTGPDWDSSLHLSNTTDLPVTVWVTGYAADGTVTGVVEEDVPAGGQLAADVEALFPGLETAWLRVAATGEVIGDVVYVLADWTRMGSYIGLPVED